MSQSVFQNIFISNCNAQTFLFLNNFEQTNVSNIQINNSNISSFVVFDDMEHLCQVLLSNISLKNVTSSILFSMTINIMSLYVTNLFFSNISINQIISSWIIPVGINSNTDEKLLFENFYFEDFELFEGFRILTLGTVVEINNITLSNGFINSSFIKIIMYFPNPINYTFSVVNSCFSNITFIHGPLLTIKISQFPDLIINQQTPSMFTNNTYSNLNFIKSNVAITLISPSIFLLGCR